VLLFIVFSSSLTLTFHLLELDLDFGGYPGYTIPDGNTFDNACCVFYLVTANTPFPEAYVAISEPWPIFKKDPGLNFTNPCKVARPSSSSSVALATSSSAPYVSVSGSPTTSVASYTTSTVYSTNIYTVTDCPATVTNCPAHYTSVVTDIVAAYTTVCPVSDPYSTPPAYTTTTSTIYGTSVYTVTECPKSIYCPDDYQSVITTVYPVSTTCYEVPVKTDAVYYPTYPVSTVSTYAAIKYTPTYNANLAEFTGGAESGHKAVSVMGAGLAAVLGLAMAL
jgi:hypothetical protein